MPDIKAARTSNEEGTFKNINGNSRKGMTSSLAPADIHNVVVVNKLTYSSFLISARELPIMIIDSGIVIFFPKCQACWKEKTSKQDP